jgi:hypothetical protein
LGEILFHLLFSKKNKKTKKQKKLDLIGETRNSSGRAPAGPVDRRGRLSRRRVKKEQKKKHFGRPE